MLSTAGEALVKARRYPCELRWRGLLLEQPAAPLSYCGPARFRASIVRAFSALPAELP
ncbi:hypothetical protein A203_18620 [Chromobacterium violaceum]